MRISLSIEYADNRIALIEKARLTIGQARLTIGQACLTIGQAVG